MPSFREKVKAAYIDVIPAEWNPISLGEVLTNRRETTQPSVDGQRRYVGLEHLDSGNPRLKRWGGENEVRSTKWRFSRGEILYGKLRPYLDKAVLTEWEGICATDILVLCSQENGAYPEYMINVLHDEALLSHAISTTTGVNHPRTSWDSLKKFKFLLPPPSEQLAIVDILSKLRDAVEVQRKVIERTKELKYSLMAKLFREGLCGEELKETEIGLIPKSWSLAPIRSLAQIRSGKRLPKDTKLIDVPTPYPYIRIVDMGSNTIELKNIRYLTPDVRARISRYVITTDDVYISIAGTTGLVGVIPEQLNGANLTENAARLTPRDGEILDKPFLMYSLASDSGQAQIRSLTMKTSQPKLALSRIETIKIGVPPIVEQREIADILNKMSEKIRISEQRESILGDLFKAMLQKLLIGEIRVNDAKSI